MRRREFIKVLAGCAAAWPTPGGAQSGSLPLVGFLVSGSPDGYKESVEAVRQGLKDGGYVDGKNVRIEYVFADNDYSRLPHLASELARRRPSVIFTTGSVVSALAAKSASADIPIVFSNGSDPVRDGLVENLNRPGRNLTGVTFYNTTLAPKRLEMLRELFPSLKAVAVLVNPNNPNAAAGVTEVTKAAAAMGITIIQLQARRREELQTVISELKNKAEAMIVHPDALLQSEHREIIRQAHLISLPTMWANPRFVRAGGLISYSTNIDDMNREAGRYIGRILRGEKPGTMPVLFPTKFELVINRKTAATLGIALPPMLIARADDVIE